MHTRIGPFTLSSVVVAIGVLSLVSLAPTMASATAMGSLNETNCGGGGVTVNATTITWLPAGTVGGTGCIVTGAGTDVTYSGGALLAGVTGNIMNLTPGGVVDNFMTFQGTSLDFVLDPFTPPVTTNGTDCAGTPTGGTCVAAAGSPFVLENLGGGNTAVALTAFGTVLDGGVTSTWSGSFSTQLNMTPAEIQSTIFGGGSITSTYAAQFAVTAVPEPATFFMIGIGLAALGMTAKRNKARS